MKGKKWCFFLQKSIIMVVYKNRQCFWIRRAKKLCDLARMCKLDFTQKSIRLRHLIMGD